MRIGIVVPHMFMHRDILPRVIFSPGQLAISLADGLVDLGHEVTLFSPGPIHSKAQNVTADLGLFEAELSGRGYGFMELLKKHPQVFITLARQVQAELVASAYEFANAGNLDIVHIYTNEEELALIFARFCRCPVAFTHHDPFNYLIRYKAVMPKYKHLPWISMSHAQRSGMPDDTNWIANIYHGLDPREFRPAADPTGGYVAYMGRIIQAKGVHLAIAAVKDYNRRHQTDLRLRIAGKHYAGHGKDSYWQEQIEPELDGTVEYVGFLEDPASKQEFLGNAEALLVPSVFPEPFGMVSIEALACGTPIIGLNTGAIPEVVEHGKTGFVVERTDDEQQIIAGLVAALERRHEISRAVCRAEFEQRFPLDRMCREHADTYARLIK